jgi:hypothetical protein
MQRGLAIVVVIVGLLRFLFSPVEDANRRGEVKKKYTEERNTKKQKPTS